MPRPRLQAPSLAIVLSLAAAFASPHAAVAQVQSKGQAKCLASLAKAGAKVVKARIKDYQGCWAAVAGGELGACPSAEACLDGDVSGKLGATLAKLDAVDAACTEAPDFGRRPVALQKTSTLGEPLGFFDDLLGPDLDAAALATATNADAAACQAKVAKAATKMMLSMGAAYETCKADGIAGGTITGAGGLASCVGAIDTDAKGKVASSRKGLDSALAASCAGVTLAAAFPGSCAAAPSFGDCVETSARCRACRRGATGDDAGADCDAFDDGVANGSCSGFSGRCNGHASLCSRPYNEVAYPTTHNAFTNAEENWPEPNQRYGLTRQLADGVRGLMLDTHVFLGEVVLCHEICDLGEAAGYHPRELLTDGLARIREYLEVDPNAVVSIIFESYITEAQAAQAFVDAGLDGLVHVQPIGDPWPTLGSIAASGKRLVVFTDDSSASLPWHHYVWDYAWETPYSFYDVPDFTCAINRGSAGNGLYILNHFLTHTFGSAVLATRVNKNPLFVDRALQCEMEGGQIPNFVTVDFYNIGPIFQVTDMLNGVAACAAP